MNKISKSGCFSFFYQFFVVFLSIALFAPAASAEDFIAPEQIDGVTRVTAEQVVDLVSTESELVIIDSRKPGQFIKGHIQGARNIQDTKMTEELLAKHVPSKSMPVIFYCYGPKCLRSANASTHAKKWGYTRIYWFRGGWKEWKDKQMPVSRLNQ